MIIGGVAFLAGTAVSGAAMDVYMAIVGRALLGVGFGFANRLSLGLAGVPAVFFTLGAIFLPETPNSLVQQGENRAKVRALLQKLAVAVLMPAFTQVSLTGSTIGFYAPMLLRTVGMGESAALLSTVVIYTASTIVLMFIIDRFGRHTLLIASSL
ncbi:hypothetical protein PR202_ga22004 [Eleusine coracana subsp. coracana]|uniref:Major facilitator superfamily (MFS) profile domain-containing protein n=1 Tax=Eleusine coracana subsp. coracana TaxID=191504 RepID=A0AAV5D0I2_ELECO|nr:hypothetical protein PR202_ga22004 [Eleusine coracana subsp. coracana]